MTTLTSACTVHRGLSFTMGASRSILFTLKIIFTASLDQWRSQKWAATCLIWIKIHSLLFLSMYKNEEAVWFGRNIADSYIYLWLISQVLRSHCKYKKTLNRRVHFGLAYKYHDNHMFFQLMSTSTAQWGKGTHAAISWCCVQWSSECKKLFISTFKSRITSTPLCLFHPLLLPG